MEENKSETPGPITQAGSGRVLRLFPTLSDLFAMLGIVLGMQILLSVGLLLMALFMGHGADIQAMDPVRLGRIMALGYLISMSVSLWGVVRYRRIRGGGGPIGNFSLKRLNPVMLVWALVFMFAMGVVLEPLLTLLPQPSTEGMGRGFWTALMLVVFAPVFEELICRGVVLGSLRARYGVVVAWLGSSLFFAVLHLQPVLVVNALFIGLILGFIYIATDSLWAAIILHAANNALAYVLMTAGYDNMELEQLLGSHTLYIRIYVAAIAVAAVSGYMTWRTIARLKEAEKNRSGA